MRIIVSGGGTGGHIFPAVSIANAIKALRPDAEILFVGANGRMEMERVPQAGYKIVGLPVRGLIRPLWSPRNVGVMLDFLKSRSQVKKVIREFNPQAVVGVGGYASSPTLNAAHSMGIPSIVQEQNSYAGVTNKSLAKKAVKICVAYEGMERFFPKERIVLTGNPVRQALLECKASREEARKAFGLEPERPTVLVIGGSLGARTVNDSIAQASASSRKPAYRCFGRQESSMRRSAKRRRRLPAPGLSTHRRSFPTWRWRTVPQMWSSHVPERQAFQSFAFSERLLSSSLPLTLRKTTRQRTPAHCPTSRQQCSVLTRTHAGNLSGKR